MAKIYAVQFGAPGLGKTKRRLPVSIPRKKFAKLDAAAEMFEGMRIHVVATRDDSEDADVQRGQDRLWKDLEGSSRKVDVIADVHSFTTTPDEIKISLQFPRKDVTATEIEFVALQRGLLSVEVLGPSDPPQRGRPKAEEVNGQGTLDVEAPAPEPAPVTRGSRRRADLDD